ncbi:uncharacterized protein LOC141679917 [Apium graveolens]|uniref:uncharacterized protein LOC141679917 n=1 Tax=Apium graveolens TaxID=4045 RepID=UPI003D7C0838
MVGFEGAYTVDAQGHSGGLVLFWRNKDEVTVQSHSKNHIDVIVEVHGKFKYRLTGFYGEPDRTKRNETWDLIRRLHTQSVLPWCIIGDLNNILKQEEKRGGHPYPSWLIQGFQQVIDDCDLNDMDMIGYPYTWERGQGTKEWIEVRLDRALVSNSFMQHFAEAKLTNMEISTSDHNPILMEPFAVSHTVVVKGLRFENAWLRDPMCRKIVEDSWQLAEGKPFKEKIDCCLAVLVKWGKEITGSFKSRINQCKKTMRVLKGRKDSNSIQLYRGTAKKLTEIYNDQEVFWRQRCKQLWLREGDSNSKYFHVATKARRKLNKISTLANKEGVQVGWDEGIQEVMIEYFSELFTATDMDWTEVVSYVNRRVTNEQNADLLLPIDPSEVNIALFNMHPDKSPGPDGMSPGFYQKYWSIVGGDLIQLVQQFFLAEKFDRYITDTNIVLIPKKQDPSNMTELRPISLCNVSYKIASKVMANRVKKVLDGVISETQSAFIPGRLISDNNMIAYEVMHYMKRKVSGKAGWMALKLDMSKAYDRVEWNFLRAMLVKLGFDGKMVNLLLECVTSARYRINHAGKEFGLIEPGRGIRQGDPLSSYIFLICMEGLTALIQENERMKNIKGIKVARGAPSLSHMFFADDSYIYCQASREVATKVINMLQVYEKASGQKLNATKSSAFFSCNVTQEERVDICNILQFQEAGANTTYLGIPSIIGRNKNVVLGYLKERMQKRMEGYDKKILSKGGKEILLKSVVQTVPSYAMGMFLLPKKLCSEMESLMCKFWWRNSAKAKGIHWMSWYRLSARKSEGGLGFRRMHEFNMALLGRQGWRLIMRPDCLVSKIYRARYYSGGSFLTASLGSNPSFVWRSIFETQEMLKKYTGRRVGSGNNIDVLHDPWLPCVDDPYIHTSHEAINGRKVNSLMVADQDRWDTELINDMFTERDANLILSIPLQRAEEDSWYWRREKMGQYSVRSAYAALNESREVTHASDNSGFWRKIWNLKIPLKVKHFLWRALTGCLPTKEQLLSRRVAVIEQCPVCNLESDTVSHILITCPFAKLCWTKVGCQIDTHMNQSFQEWLSGAVQKYKGEELLRICMVCWSIWKNRNSIVWNQKGAEFVEVVASATQFLDHWKNAQDRSYDSSFGFMTLNDGEVHWKPPHEGTIKVNTDAALFEDSNCYAYAIVARDHEGKLVEAVSSCRQGRVDPELAEAIGIREALSWIKAKAWPSVILETDCLTVTQAIRCSSINLSYLGRVIDECKRLLTELVNREVVLKFVKRSANNVAHYIARHSSSLADRVLRGEDVPPDFIHVLFNDLRVE